VRLSALQICKRCIGYTVRFLSVIYFVPTTILVSIMLEKLGLPRVEAWFVGSIQRLFNRPVLPTPDGWCEEPL
jgi:hypothetical protein